MKTENQKQDTEEVYLNQLIDEANKEFSLDRKLAKKVALKFAKWQQERSYNEEEVGELLYNVIGEYGKHYGIMIDGKMLNDLFEQFKK